ncbi:hypothetical protein BJN34_32015 [Cupriavidus necator]|uniref:Ig-like domain-containing protein n=1 Tax=Cupriavidus necator TaxID=106590 RepID=A0A1U9V0T3_CUPNE|nr:hypothetical protein [Cupriavidus necator]AQV98503.1 hypothetical protein BJN34_32015 [Cupriavidus necator]
MFAHAIPSSRLAAVVLLALVATLPGCGGGDSTDSATDSSGGGGGGGNPPTTITAAPQITQQPQSTSVQRLTAATFSVAVASSSQPQYQWRKNGTAIPNATQSTYTTDAAGFHDDGATFDVVVANSAGTVTSQSATLTVQNKYAAYLLAGKDSEPGTADGVGTAARFNTPLGLAVDDSGNAYISDSANFTIRKLKISSGAVSTFAGQPGSPAVADGPKSTARIGGFRTFIAPNSPVLAGNPPTKIVTGTVPAGITGISVTADGGIVFSDGNTIRRAAPDGSITTLLGIANEPGIVDGGPGTARFNLPREVVIIPGTADGFVFDSLPGGNFYGLGIRKLSVSTTVNTASYFSGDYNQYGFIVGSPTASRYDSFSIMVPDAHGGVDLVLLGSFGSIVRVDPQGTSRLITTVDKTTDGQLCRWIFMGARDADGSLYVIDACKRLLKVLPTGEFTNILDLSDSLPNQTNFDVPAMRLTALIPGTKSILLTLDHAVYVIYFP